MIISNLARPRRKSDEAFAKQVKRAKLEAAQKLQARAEAYPHAPRPSSRPSSDEETPPATPTTENYAYNDTTPVVNPPPSGQFKPLEFDNAYEFHKFFWPDFELYDWQKETLLQISGFPEGKVEGEPLVVSAEDPVIYSLVAANGSGKSKQIVAVIALFLCACKVRYKSIITSASFTQLKHNTFIPIADAAREINHFLGYEFFESVECFISCPQTGSIIRGFATDQPGRAEGEHPNPGSGMAVLIDEAKSIDDAMFTAFSRFTGYSIWLEVSSPGPCEGHFYRRVITAKQRWPDKLALGRVYTRRVTAFECPRSVTRSHIEQFKLEHLETSILYRSSILAEFTSIDDLAIIKQEESIYVDPPHTFLSLPVVAGLDIALGGDETVLSIWHGNKRRKQYTWRIKEAGQLHIILIETFMREGLLAENINGDGGGIGKPVIQRLHENGWPINIVRNDAAAFNKKEYLNRGIELWFKIKRLVEGHILILPREDELLMNQLVTRRYLYSNGKLKVEPKPDAKARGVPSPDRADAMVLAFAKLPLDAFINPPPEDLTPQKAEDRLKGMTIEEIQELVSAGRAKREAPRPQLTASFLMARGEQRTGRFTGMISRRRF